jgi:hypothetical protein
MTEHSVLHTLLYYPRLTLKHPLTISSGGSNNKIGFTQPGNVIMDTASMIPADADELKSCPLLEPVRPSDIVISDHDVADSCPLLEAECSRPDSDDDSCVTAAADGSAVKTLMRPPLLIAECQPSVASVTDLSEDIISSSSSTSIQKEENVEALVKTESELQCIKSTTTTAVCAGELGLAHTLVAEVHDDDTSSQGNCLTAVAMTEVKGCGGLIDDNCIPCSCVLQCPYCYFSIASVRLLRQHVIFHVAVSDAVMTPLFDSRLDDLEDGTVCDADADRCTSLIRICSRCQCQSNTLERVEPSTAELKCLSTEEQLLTCDAGSGLALDEQILQQLYFSGFSLQRAA